jgi:hypothetical protein
MTKAKNRLVTHTLTTIRLASATSISLILDKAAIRHASPQTRLAKLAARRDSSDWQRLCELVKSFKTAKDVAVRSPPIEPRADGLLRPLLLPQLGGFEGFVPAGERAKVDDVPVPKRVEPELTGDAKGWD